MKTITCTYCGTQAIYGDRLCGGCNARIYYGTGVLDLFKWSLLAAAIFLLLFIKITEYYSLSGFNQYAWYILGIPFFLAAVIIARVRRNRVTFQHHPRL